MQKCCSEDRPLDVVPPGTGTKVANAGNRNGSRQCREQERKRVVLPPPTLPKNVIAVLTRAGEHSGQRRSGGLLFHLVCAQETEWGELSKQRKQWISLAQKLKKIFFMQDRTRLLYYSQPQPRRHGRSSDRRIRPWKKLLSSCLKTSVTPEFKNGITLACN